MSRKHVKILKEELTVTPFNPSPLREVGPDDDVTLTMTVNVPGWTFDEGCRELLRMWVHAKMDRLIDDIEMR